MEFIQTLGYLHESEVKDRKCSLEDILRLSPSLNENDSLLYFIYLHVRPDLPEEERIYYSELAKSLKEKEDMNMRALSQLLSQPKSENE